MNPLRLRAENYRTYVELDLAFPDGCVGVTGLNGAGKSTIVGAIDIALFGPEGRSLDPYLSDEAITGDTMLLELEFEHRGDRYRIRRTFTRQGGGRGKASCDFERDAATPEAAASLWQPLTQGTVADTQTLIEATLGLSRETFRASAMLTQGDGDAFTGAAPRDRKRILANVLGLDFWDRCNNLARGDRREREKQSQTLNGRLTLLDERVGGGEQARAQVADLAELLQQAEGLLAETSDQATAAKITHEQLAERARNAAAARSAIDAARAGLTALARERDSAANAAGQAAAFERIVPELKSACDELASVEAERDLLLEAKQAYDLEQARRSSVQSELEQVSGARAVELTDFARATERRDDLLDKAAATESAPSAICDRCEQPLADAARAAAVASLRRDAAIADQQAVSHSQREHQLGERETALTAQLGEIPPAAKDEVSERRFARVVARLGELHGAGERYATAVERHAGLQATATLRQSFADEVTEATRTLQQHTAELEWANEPEPGAVDDSRAAVDEAERAAGAARSRAEEARVRLAQATTRLELIEQAAREHSEALAERDRIDGELEELELLTRGFGRDGVPSFIIETSAIPAIELEADRLLAALGTNYRAELRLRELKDGTVSDELDVMVVTDHGVRSYETFSGGERTRINLAFRIALARLLANRRGAESRMLAIDEPDGLDEDGMAALVAVLRDLAGSGFDRLLLVSHVPVLQDAFDTTIRVSKVNGRSEVLVA